MSEIIPDVSATPAGHRLHILDGWRALSIVLVLAGHLLPIGPSKWQLNGAVAAMGMAIFFTLSGFLITRFLAEPGADLRVFIIRRFFRIIPLAWIAVAVALLMVGGSSADWAANLLFYANLPPFHLVPPGAHLWSLGVEMQFYVGIALLVALGGARGLYVLPLLCITVTGLRVTTDTLISIVTWLRVDEILVGGILALLYEGWFGPRPMRLLSHVNVYLILPLALLASDPISGPFMYLRPYLVATMVGASLVNAPVALARLFEGRAASYIAKISYALYVIHGVASQTWLGTGGHFGRYLKRPLLFAVTFGLAHLSTFWLEQPCIDFARSITRRWKVRVAR